MRTNPVMNLLPFATLFPGFKDLFIFLIIWKTGVENCLFFFYAQLFVFIQRPLVGVALFDVKATVEETWCFCFDSILLSRRKESR